MSDESKPEIPIAEVQTPLVDDRLPTDGEARANLGVLPPGFVVPQDAIGPDRETRSALRDMPEKTLCGSPFTIVWKAKQSSGFTVPKGMPLRLYCQRPGCLTTGSCTGAYFVPSMPQFTHADVENPLNRRREVTAEEIIAGARHAAVRATGKPDPRSDQQIARHVGTVLKNLQRALHGEGGWRA